MKYKRKICSTILLLMLCLGLMGSLTSAEEKELKKTTGKSMFVTRLAENNQIMPRGTYLASGYSSIAEVSGRTISVYGATDCYRTADVVDVTVYLERYNGSSWYTYTYWSTKTAYDAHFVSYSTNITVPAGTYRVFSTHYVRNGSTEESTTSKTGSLTV